MNYSPSTLRQIAAYSPLDVLLADVAVRVQLTPTDYQAAVDHYQAISDWLDRSGSPLEGKVLEFYPQGGFSIGATVARHSTSSDFDIDVIAQIEWSPHIDPEEALATLHDAIASVQGTRYHDKTERKTRCSTVNYADMHLDVTPVVRTWGRNEKTSYIFHSKPSDPSEPKKTLLANPFGFAEWFKTMTPPDTAFGEFFERRSLDYNRVLFDAKAETAPVPDQMPAYRKSRAVIALQLIKRWRNLLYDRLYSNLRLPPSVLLAHYVALNANRTNTLADELIHQVDVLRSIIGGAEAENRLVHAQNEMCREDILTDRWPGDRLNQRIFLKELDGFVADLRLMRDGGLSLADMLKVMERLFGEKPARDAYDGFIRQQREDLFAGKNVHIPKVGAIAALGSLAAPATARSTPYHTDFGDPETGPVRR
ncbi:MAG: nucleotidyltransferase [Alphaproteobacteria bacterium]|nr:MAG: nucleotidyltransferase [Alphaproteobacteria bacterium]